MKATRQLFIIPDELWDRISVEEVNATYNDMAELNIAQPPFDAFDVSVPMKRLFHNAKTHKPFETGADSPIIFRYDKDQPCRELIPETKRPERMHDVSSMIRLDKNRINNDVEEAEASLLRALIVLLATKNIIKEVKENKLAKLGIGKSPYKAITTIRVGVVTEHSENYTNHSSPRPHLRRGHIRNQPYGTGRELVKKIFIHPIFINADEGWIAQRTAYRLG